MKSSIKSMLRFPKGGMDITFFLLTLALLGMGLIMLFSSSYAYALYYYGDSYIFIKSQVLFSLMGVAMMIFISYFDYHLLHHLAVVVYVIVIALLIFALFSPTIKGTHRWVVLFGIQFQPSEIAKFGVVLILSHVIAHKGKQMDKFVNGFLLCFAFLGPVVVLVFLEKHLSGTILITILGAVIMFIGGVKLRWFVLFGSAGAALAAAYIALTNKMGYAIERIQIWLDPTIDPTDTGHQILQSLYAIGSGGLLGQGLGNSRQKYLYVPEPQNDFIFSIICEELGFVGATFIIILFALFVWRGFVIAMRARDRFGSLLAMGLTTQIGVQAILNIAVVTGTIPNTGISLPFFSYGGSSLVMLLCQMGVVLSVSRFSVMEKA